MKLVVRNSVLDLSTTQVMGILNVTSDSFFDGGVYYDLPKAIDHTNNMINHGATLIDIGGESTRPGAKCISDQEELDRVLPVVYEILKRFDVFVSVNTSSGVVMRESSTAGVHLINDVRSLESDLALKVASESKFAICLMHMKGNPSTMQNAPYYSKVLDEVDSYFNKQIIRCESAGISRNRLLIDPGFGFGKKLEHNYQLLSNIKFFYHFGIPILIGVSRKSMLSQYRNDSPKQRLIGSIACAVYAAMQNVQIIRVHDVQETIEALNIIKMIREFSKCN